jgi:alanine racemase
MAGYPHRCYVEISLGRIAENFRAVLKAVGQHAEVTPVVKADAYGHGAREVGRVLEREGAKWLAVSSVDEGVTLRESGVQTRILVMAGFLRHEEAALAEFHLTPVVHDLGDLDRLEQLGRSAGRTIPFHLKLDTGMARLGVLSTAAEMVEQLSGLRSAEFEGLMTHLASAADYNSLQTDHQIERYRQIESALEQAGICPRYRHTSSTNAVAYGRCAEWQTMVRPGHAIYGYVSPPRGEAPPCTLKVRPALEWRSKILLVKDIPEGALVGYGGSYRAPRPMRIAVVSAGYADGIPHRLSNKGRVLICGKPAPIIGTVSMDLTTIDVTRIPGVSPGDEVVLLGEGLDAQQIARMAGTISYNVLCGISARVKRIYVG